MALIKPYENGMVEDERVPRRSATTDLLCKWLVHQLVDSYRYPEDWVGHRIVRLERGSSDADIAVLTQWREPFILCTVSSSAEEAEKRLRRVLPSSSASMGLSTDGSSHGTKFLRKGAGGEKLELIPDIDAHSQPPDFTVLFAGRKAGRSVDQTSRYLTGLSDRVANVFFEAHSHIRDIDGMHSDEALDEVCKILFAKMFDEQNPDEEGRPKMQRALYGSTEEFASAVRGVYKTAAETVNGRGSARGENGVFASRLRLTSAALARVVETLQEYDLLASGTDVKGRAFQKVLIPAIRAGMGQYFTPEPVVKFIVRAVAPTSGDTILDPFCGSGHFLSAALEHVRSSALKLSPDVETFALRSLHGIEKSDRMVRVAITDMRLQGDGHSNIRFADALLGFENYPNLTRDSFDIVMTNPPFGSLLGADALTRLGAFDLARGRTNAPLEVLGLERSIQFLRPGGRLAIVVPEGILVNRAMRHVRDWLSSQVKIRGIVSLPIETFVPFGAGIKTSILFGRKWKAGEKSNEDYGVFLGRADNVGYDASGRTRTGCELEELNDRFTSFVDSEGW